MNNQLSGYGYGTAGNMTHDLTSGLTYTFGQEDRITGADGYTYIYDGDGTRVRKSNGNLAGNGTLYWYMTPGVVAETDLAGTTTSEYIFFGGERVARRDGVNGVGGVFYYFSDHLKTASVVTDSASVIKAESDYYPWGGELQITANDSNHYKFTSKERDSETGLDYFGARYYSNGLGRWVSADWSSMPIPVPYADFYDPQTLNLYQFVGGNPASKADANGHEIPLDPQTAQKIGENFSRNTEAAIHFLKSIGNVLAQANASLPPPSHGPMLGPRICPTPEPKTQDNKQNNNNSQSTNQNENSGGQKTSSNGAGREGTSGNGRAPSKIDRAAFKSEREAFWKAEAKANPEKYSPENLARMEKGKAPIGSDGHPMELHHVDGTQNGGLEPMTRTDHRLGENYQKNHPN